MQALWLAKQYGASRVAVHEVSPCNRPNFAIAEEAGAWVGTEYFGHHTRIVVGGSKQVAPSSAAGKDQRGKWLAASINQPSGTTAKVIGPREVSVVP